MFTVQGKSKRKYMRKVGALVQSRLIYKARIPNIGACVVYHIACRICASRSYLCFCRPLTMHRGRAEEFGSGVVARRVGRRAAGGLPCVHWNTWWMRAW